MNPLYLLTYAYRKGTPLFAIFWEIGVNDQNIGFAFEFKFFLWSFYPNIPTVHRRYAQLPITRLNDAFRDQNMAKTAIFEEILTKNAFF